MNSSKLESIKIHQGDKSLIPSGNYVACDTLSQTQIKN